MVGQADNKTNILYAENSPLLNQRELIILTLGLINKPVTIDEAYTFAKNLSARISFILAYPIPNPSVFRDIITKMVKNRELMQSYSLVRKKYTIDLGDQGEGEFDYLIHSIANKQLIRKFDEFRSLIDLFY